jgi:hypothetical protein
LMTAYGKSMGSKSPLIDNFYVNISDMGFLCPLLPATVTRSLLICVLI